MNCSDIISGTMMVKRFNGKRIEGHRRSIAEHHYEVSLYSSMLFRFPEFSSAVLDYTKSVDLISDNPDSILNQIELEVIRNCLVHDIPEVFTSDVPYPIKAAVPNLKEALEEAERFVVDGFPDTLKYMYTYEYEATPVITKIADIIVVVLEIFDEHNLHNNIIQPKGVSSICLELFKNLLNKNKKTYQNEDSDEALISMIMVALNYLRFHLGVEVLFTESALIGD